MRGVMRGRCAAVTYLELVETVVSELGAAEEEAALEDAQGRARRHRVEVADLPYEREVEVSKRGE